MAPLTKEMTNDSAASAPSTLFPHETDDRDKIMKDMDQLGMLRPVRQDLKYAPAKELKLSDSRSKLHPYVKSLTISDLDSCLALEATAFPPDQRASREKAGSLLFIIGLTFLILLPYQFFPAPTIFYDLRHFMSVFILMGHQPNGSVVALPSDQMRRVVYRTFHISSPQFRIPWCGNVRECDSARLIGPGQKSSSSCLCPCDPDTQCDCQRRGHGLPDQLGERLSRRIRSRPSRFWQDRSRALCCRLASLQTHRLGRDDTAGLYAEDATQRRG